jgi:Tol biopolymer transport system component
MLLAGPLGAQSGYDLFQQALAKERGEGKLDEAIQLYQRIVRDFGKDHALAARALVQMGRDYEKLGRDEARKAYERVVRDFGDQREAAAEARARMASLTGVTLQTGDRRPSARLVSADAFSGAIIGAPAANGRNISYTDAVSGNLALFDLGARTSRSLTTLPASNGWTEYAETHVPSPDGSQVAFAWYTSRGGYELRLARTAPPAAPARTLVADTAVVWMEPFGWTPDGRRVIAYFQYFNGDHALVVVDAATGAQRRLYAPRGEPTKADVSPDGRWVVFDDLEAANGSQQDLFLVPIDGGEPRRIVQNPAQDVFPMWTGDGSGIVFRSDRTGTAGVWYLPVKNGTPAGAAHLLKPDMASSIPLGLTRDGTLYYLTGTEQRNILSAEVDVAAGKVVQPPAIVADRFVGANAEPDWSPDGRSLAFVSRRIPYTNVPASRVLCILSLDTRQQREFVLPLSNWHQPRWSPDGRSILVWGVAANRKSGIHRVDVATGTVTPVVELPLGGFVQAVTWAPDGRSMYYVANDGPLSGRPGRYLAVRAIDSGAARVLFRPSGIISSPAVSRDGKWVAFVTSGVAAVSLDSAELHVMSTTDGSGRVVRHGRTAWARGMNWSSDGSEILYFAPSGKTLQWWAVNVASGATRQLGLSAPSVNAARLSPDGRHLVFSAGEGNDQVWVLEHFLPAAPAAGRHENDR